MLAYWSGFIVIIVALTVPDESRDEKDAAGLLALSVLGFGEVVGAIVSGLIIDNISSKAGVFFNILTIIICWACTYSILKLNQRGPLVNIFSFSWGLMDGSISTHVA